jgi:hypothetical protein
VTPFFERLRSAMTRVKIAPFTTHTSAFSRHWLPELCRKSCPQRHKGAGNAGRFGAPAALCAKGKSTQVSHHRFADYAGTPCAIGFNGLLRALPGDRAFCHHHRRNASVSIVANLTMRNAPRIGRETREEEPLICPTTQGEFFAIGFAKGIPANATRYGSCSNRGRITHRH